MKIGVFGDSYADKSFLRSDSPSIWYNFLKTEYNHTIECFGEGGSSILFSAELIKKHAQNYDLIIWCVTTPGRFSLPHANGDRSYHVTTANDKCKSNDIEVITKHKICIDYLKYIFNWDTENLVSKALISFIQQEYPNLLIIPCFPPPLGAEFNLYKLCSWESNFYFPNQEIPEIYKNYYDMRPGHITVDNQKILAKLINDNLSPGIFQTSYSNFVQPQIPLEQVFKKR
jgi:hypothetical protein